MPGEGTHDVNDCHLGACGIANHCIGTHIHAVCHGSIHDVYSRCNASVATLHTGRASKAMMDITTMPLDPKSVTRRDGKGKVHLLQGELKGQLSRWGQCHCGQALSLVIKTRRAWAIIGGLQYLFYIYFTSFMGRLRNSNHSWLVNTSHNWDK